MGSLRRITGLVLGAVLMATAADAADRQVRLFLGATFAGSTTFVDLSGEDAPSQAHLSVGGNFAVLGEIFGVDVDASVTPGFFQGSKPGLVLKSSVTTATGNIVIAMPRRWSEYSLRLYFLAGGGIMRVRAEDVQLIYDIAEVMPAMDLGFGALGFLTNRVGLSWELRRFQRVGEPPPLTGISLGPEQLSFWRAHMAVVIRY